LPATFNDGKKEEIKNCKEKKNFKKAGISLASKKFATGARF
jgi:hypothetical protein